MTPPGGPKIFANCREMGKNDKKWPRNGDFFRFSHMVTLISFIIAYWTYWQNFKSSWALKPDLYVMYIFHKINQFMEYMDYCICILSIYGYPEKKILNAKKSSWFFLWLLIPLKFGGRGCFFFCPKFVIFFAIFE